METSEVPQSTKTKKPDTHQEIGSAEPSKQARKGSKGNQPHNKSLKKISHSLSWALRHNALQLKLTMTPDGFVPLEEILQSKHPKLKGFTETQIRQVVAENDKQRFSLQMKPAAEYAASPIVGNSSAAAAAVSSDDETAIIWCIRANQGHSIPGIDPHLLLTRLKPDELVALPVIIHGTYFDAWKNIQKSGYLSRMNRNHMHFAAGLPGENGVISGMRKSCEVYIYVDAIRCARDGIVFFRSDNGVLLTAGVNNEGELPISYFSHVKDTTGRILFDRREK